MNCRIRHLLIVGVVLGMGCAAALVGADSSVPSLSEINSEVVRQNPNVLYIDLANPADARGIRPATTNEALRWQRIRISGAPAVAPTNNVVSLMLDPAIVTNGMPILIAFNYYDADTWQGPHVGGVTDRPRESGWVYTKTFGAYQDDWRWFTLLTYANFGHARNKWAQSGTNASHAGFSISWPKGATGGGRFRWVVVLPLTLDLQQAVLAQRERVLAMVKEYNRLMAAEARLQYARQRVEQGRYYQNGRTIPNEFEELCAETKARAGEARLVMDKVIEEIIPVMDRAYLVFFDGAQSATSGWQDERMNAVEAFQVKVTQLAAQYDAAASNATARLAAHVASRMTDKGLTPIQYASPPEMPPDHLVTPADWRERMFFGIIYQTGLMGLPQANVESLRRDNAIDFTYQYNFCELTPPRKDGTFDFSELDAMLAAPKTMRVIFGMHNILLPPWAKKKYLDPSTRQPEGPVSANYRTREGPGKPPGVVNIRSDGTDYIEQLGEAWSDTFIRYNAAAHRAVGEHFKTNPVILRYQLNGEGGVEWVRKQGYIFDAARPYYQDYLKRKFGTIAAVNKAFGTNYPAFDAIPLPKPEEGEKMVRLTPAYYEYIQLAIERAKLARESKALALREGDPIHAIGEVNQGWFGASEFDNYLYAVDTPYDTFTTGDSDIRSCRYIYSLNRYKPRPICTYEPYTYVPFQPPEGKGYRVEEPNRQMLTANLWTWYFWDHQGLPFFNSRSPTIRSDVTDLRLMDILLYRGTAQQEPLAINPAMRLCAGSLVAVKPEFDQFRTALKAAPVVQARIGVLESATTYAVPYPPGGPFGDLFQLQNNLTGRHFFFMLETAILKGVESLDPYRVIITSHGTHLRPEVREKLLEWVRRGGILITSGPLAIYDHYGRTDKSLPEQVFGMKDVTYAPEWVENRKVGQCHGPLAGKKGESLWGAKDYFWRLPATNLAEGTVVWAALDDGTPLMVERAFGNGKVIMTASPIGVTPNLYWPLVAAELGRQQPVPEAQTSQTDLMLIVREDKEGVRYLCVINRNVVQALEAPITVAGEFPMPQDVTVGAGYPIPALVTNGTTQIRVWMGPGMGNFIRLGKPLQDLRILTPEAECARWQLSIASHLLTQARSLGLATTGLGKAMERAQAEFGRRKYGAAVERLSAENQALAIELLAARAKAIRQRVESDARETSPVAGTWAQTYADIAEALARSGKVYLAEDRMAQAERTLAEKPAAKKADEVFPFVTNRLDIEHPEQWPKEGWQVIYKDQKTQRPEAGRFLLVGSPQGLYLAAEVTKSNVLDRAPSTGDVAWRVMDGVIFHIRCLDRTVALPPEFRSEDTYELTLYANGSVFMWENPLPDSSQMVQCRAIKTRLGDLSAILSGEAYAKTEALAKGEASGGAWAATGYRVAAFVPAEVIRFRPVPGITFILNVAVSSHGEGRKGERVDYYWRGSYTKANSWVRVQLGEGRTSDSGSQTPDVSLPAIVLGRRRETRRQTPDAGPSHTAIVTLTNSALAIAEPCEKVAHWLPYTSRGVGGALATYDPAEVLPNGKRGAVALSLPAGAEKGQMLTQFMELGKRKGVRVWLRGEKTGGILELRLSGREGYSWAIAVPDDSDAWRAVEIVPDAAKPVKEEVFFEEMGGHERYRVNANRLIIQLERPAANVKVGSVDYLE